MQFIVSKPTFLFCLSKKVQPAFQAFNNMLEFSSGSSVVSFWLDYPRVKCVNSNTLLIRSFNSLVIRNISLAQKYKKGSKWSISKLSLHSALQLSYHDFSYNRCIELRDEGLHGDKIRVQFDNQNQKYIFEMGGNSQGVGITAGEYELVRRTVQAAGISLYGLEYSFEMERERLAVRVESGEIMEQEEVNDDYLFRL